MYFPVPPAQPLPQCQVCGSSHDGPGNSLVCVLACTGFDDEDEYVHARCARHSTRYATCWCCEANHQLKIYLAEVVNRAGECPDHAGESMPNYPVEDQESYIEYVQGHE